MMRSVKRWGLAASIALALAGCGGGGGDDTPVTPPGSTPSGPPVAVPTGTSPITLTANTSPTTFAALGLKVNVGRVTISGPPVVDFSITDIDGNAVLGFGRTSQSATATVAQYANLAFSLAKLVPGTNGAPSKWVSYIVTTVPSTTAAAAPTRPSTDNTGTLVDHGNGTYTYTFYRDITTVKDQVAAMTVTGANNKDDLGDLTYEPNLVHRLTMQVSGNAPGTGTNTANAVQVTPGVPLTQPVDVIHDFVPATGQAVTDSARDIVATQKCNECHRQLGGIPGGNPESQAAGFHGGSRNETRYCVVCHTEQRKYGQTEATLNATTNTFTTATRVVDGRAIGNLPNFIHKIHAGPLLAKQNYDYAGVKANEVHYPQDLRNCTKCHDGSDTSTAKTAQGDNWMNVPSRLACGSCRIVKNRAAALSEAVRTQKRGFRTAIVLFTDLEANSETGTEPPADRIGAHQHLWGGCEGISEEAAMLRHDLSRLIVILPDSLRQCCHWLIEDSVGDVCRRTGLARGSIHSRINTLRRRCRECGLENYFTVSPALLRPSR